MYFQISRIFNLGQNFSLEFGGNYIDGGATHFLQYFNAKDISFQTVSNAKAWRLFFEINYTIYSYLPNNCLESDVKLEFLSYQLSFMSIMRIKQSPLQL